MNKFTETWPDVKVRLMPSRKITEFDMYTSKHSASTPPLKRHQLGSLLVLTHAALCRVEHA